MGKRATILVVDDEVGVRQSFKMVLKDAYELILAKTGKEALDVLTRRSVDLVLLDILLPDMNGIEILEKIKQADPETDVIMVTAVKDVNTAVKAIKIGAYQYIIKPFDVDDLLALIQRALEKRRLVREVAYLRGELNRYHYFEKMVGEDRKMVDLYRLIDTIIESDGAVLIQGESGTGKELVARAIHNRSKRKNQPFVAINCAAIPATLVEGELFGHVKGAFTGATQSRAGRLEIADKGTVFLDDIDCLDVNMQAKLLRVIQEKEFERLGSTQVVQVHVRFVAASNKNIQNLISEEKFREDLFYRLNVFPVKVPPLRERKGDIPLLLNHFLDFYAKKAGKPPKVFSERAIERLKNYQWPGNIRELQNLVERLFTVISGDVIGARYITNYELPADEIRNLPLKKAVNQFEKQYITEALHYSDGNRKKAAEKLGIHRNTLLSKMNDLGLKI